MTQPRNKRAATGGNGRYGCSVAAFSRLLPPFGFVAANIPRANRILPQPANSRGSPVALNTRANQYTAPLTPGVVSAQSANRATRGTGLAAVMRARAASSPWPYCTPDGQ